VDEEEPVDAEVEAEDGAEDEVGGVEADAETDAVDQEAEAEHPPPRVKGAGVAVELGEVLRDVEEPEGALEVP